MIAKKIIISSCVSFVPLCNLLAEVGVATATDQFDLVRHLGRHGEERKRVGPRDCSGRMTGLTIFLLGGFPSPARALPQRKLAKDESKK